MRKPGFVVCEQGAQPGVGRADQVQLLPRGASGTFASGVDRRCDEAGGCPLTVDFIV